MYETLWAKGSTDQLAVHSRINCAQRPPLQRHAELAACTDLPERARMAADLRSQRAAQSTELHGCELRESGYWLAHAAPLRRHHAARTQSRRRYYTARRPSTLDTPADSGVATGRADLNARIDWRSLANKLVLYS